MQTKRLALLSLSRAFSLCQHRLFVLDCADAAERIITILIKLVLLTLNDQVVVVVVVEHLDVWAGVQKGEHKMRRDNDDDD